MVALAGLLNDLSILPKRANLVSNNAEEFIFTEIKNIISKILSQDTFPFDCDGKNSFLNAIKSHNDNCFLSKILNESSRISLGINRSEYEKEYKLSENDNATYLLSLFEQIRLNLNTSQRYKYVYDIKPLSCKSVYPIQSEDLKDSNAQIQDKYKSLWLGLIHDLKINTPDYHKKNIKLFLDDLDSALQCYTSLVPFKKSNDKKSRADVPLYDHLRTSAAIACALWRYHHENKSSSDNISFESEIEQNAEKFLLIQGDFFGIQDFIFSEGAQTNKNGAKLLRGRSFYVSLITEIVALKILETLELPVTSQINNAAGKFLILAPNTKTTVEKLEQLKKEISDWFLQNTFGKANVGIVYTKASAKNFLQHELSNLTTKLFLDLDEAKFQSFNLANLKENVFNVDYTEGICEFNGFMPAQLQIDGKKCSYLSYDQILIGRKLVSNADKILIATKPLDESGNWCKLPILGYYFTLGKDNKSEKQDSIIRCWDFSLPKTDEEILFNGYARRNINCYIPLFNEEDISHPDKYTASLRSEEFNQYQIKSFQHLSCEDRHPSLEDHNKYIGQKAIMSLKGDVDNLGLTFQKGLINIKENHYMSFAKLCGLSRMMNNFFSICLSNICTKDEINGFRNIYTIYAGGDDFFMIGPWKKIQSFALTMKEKFENYVSKNPEVHFCAGMVMLKPDMPLAMIADLSEESLEKAKQIDKEKNAVNIFGRSVKWDKLENINSFKETLEDNQYAWGISQTFLYSLFNTIDLADKKNDPLANIWRSQLYYRVARIMENKYPGKDNAANKKRNQDEVLNTLVNAINNYSGDIRIALSNIFYDIRED